MKVEVSKETLATVAELSMANAVHELAKATVDAAMSQWKRLAVDETALAHSPKSLEDSAALHLAKAKLGMLPTALTEKANQCVARTMKEMRASVASLVKEAAAKHAVDCERGVGHGLD